MSFDFPGFTPNFGRQAQLVQLSPVEAARALLEGNFGIGDELALGFALRKDPRITLDDGIMDVWMELYDELDDEYEALSDHVSPEAFLDRLVTASRP